MFFSATAETKTTTTTKTVLDTAALIENNNKNDTDRELNNADDVDTSINIEIVTEKFIPETILNKECNQQQHLTDIINNCDGKSL